MAQSENARAAIYMTLAMAGFVVNDTITKFTASELNVGQIMFVRGLFATIFIVLLAWKAGAFNVSLRATSKLVFVRALAEMCATGTFLIAIAHLPLANMSAVLQALPLAVTMGAALFLGDRVGWRRWTAITVGFIGVLIVVRPGLEGFNSFSVLTLLSVFFCAVRDLVTRKVPASVPTLLISSVSSASVCLLGAIMIEPMGGWRPMEPSTVFLLLLCAGMLIIGYQCVIAAMRSGDISFVAPFRYTSLIWAIALGFAVFSEIPDMFTLIGSVVIIASGIYMLYRERAVDSQFPAAKSTYPSMAPDGV
ncbi:DMT family transporter [Corticibacterium sp. UT-5YL-CI-8]|nr:DMT family transporter [Tianweitania sp. UT-5YL-CI-8]